MAPHFKCKANDVGIWSFLQPDNPRSATNHTDNAEADDEANKAIAYRREMERMSDRELEDEPSCHLTISRSTLLGPSEPIDSEMIPTPAEYSGSTGAAVRGTT